MENRPCVLICWYISYCKRRTSIATLDVTCDIFPVETLKATKFQQWEIFVSSCVSIFSLPEEHDAFKVELLQILELPIKTYLLWSICVSFIVHLFGIQEGPDRSEGLCLLFGQTFACNPKCFRQATKTLVYPKWGGTEWHDHECLYANLIRRTYDIRLTTKQTYTLTTVINPLLSLVILKTFICTSPNTFLKNSQLLDVLTHLHLAAPPPPQRSQRNQWKLGSSDPSFPWSGSAWKRRKLCTRTPQRPDSWQTSNLWKNSTEKQTNPTSLGMIRMGIQHIYIITYIPITGLVTIS